MGPLPGHWVDGGWLGRLIWPFRGVAAFAGRAHARLGVRSRARLGRALRSGQLNRPRVQEVLAAEAGVALAAVRVEDPEGCSPPGWTGPVAGDDHLRSLADHVPSEADPRSTGQLEPDPSGFGDRGRDAGDEPRWLEHDQGDPGPASQRREPAEAVGNARGSLDPRREVDDEEVHGPAGEERTGDREPLVRVLRGEDDEPLQLDSAGDGLDRIEGCREVHPGHDRAGRLGFRDEAQSERRPAAREVTSERETHPARQATGAEDRVEIREAGREDA
jgi:hypothetical protein